MQILYTKEFSPGFSLGLYLTTKTQENLVALCSYYTPKKFLPVSSEFQLILVT
ncbi:MAG: hypothetical protein N2748_04135 [candidate division WOR-3 bacterium]|nr:hypothetical protein [candidate division WOR-3 bacterium]